MMINYFISLSITTHGVVDESIANGCPLNVSIKGHLRGPRGNAGQWRGECQARASSQHPSCSPIISSQGHGGLDL